MQLWKISPLYLLTIIIYLILFVIFVLQDVHVPATDVSIVNKFQIELFHNIIAHVKPIIHKFFLNAYASNHIIHLIATAIAHLKNMQQVIIMIMIAVVKDVASH